MQDGILLNNTYRILRPINSGGLGEIYLGYHENLRKYVVIKKVKDYCSGLMNNRIEVDILKGLHHTYLPQVYDFIEIDSGIFTVMDYISGYDLKYYMDNGYRFSEEQLTVWLKQLCEVLNYLHTRKQKIIHCDIKPGNIMITEDGNVCLIDFNISLDGENNKDLVGLSSSYASPEQIKKAEHKMRYGSGDTVKMDERTDIYSLGAVFYYLMSGIRPDTRSGYISPLTSMELPYSEGFINIIEKAMALEPGKRFKSAAKMLEALEHQERWTIQYQKMWKKRVILGVSATCIVSILTVAIWFGYRNMKNKEFFTACDTFTEHVNTWVEEQNAGTDDELVVIAKELINEGISILNESDYKSRLKRYEEEKQNLLYGVAQAYLYLEDYSEAEQYLEELTEEEVDRPEIYRDMAIVQAKQENVYDAEKMMEEAVVKGLDEEESNLLMAAISMAKHNYEEAWAFAMEASESTDLSVAQKAAYYIMEIANEQGNTEECVTVLADIASRSDGMMKDVWLRKQGELCLQLYEEGKKAYLREASVCFESIYKRGYAQKTDLYNLAAIYSDKEEYEKAERLLLDMKKSYPKEYKIPMYLSFVIYKEEGKKAVSARNYNEMEKYYNEAVKICKNQGIDAESDTNLMQLNNLIEQLRDQGWLK